MPAAQKAITTIPLMNAFSTSLVIVVSELRKLLEKFSLIFVCFETNTAINSYHGCKRNFFPRYGRIPYSLRLPRFEEKSRKVRKFASSENILIKASTQRSDEEVTLQPSSYKYRIV